jgi:hypothetical protein
MDLYFGLRDTVERTGYQPSTCDFLFNKTGELIKKSVSLSLQKNIFPNQKNLKLKLIQPLKFR